MKILYFDTCFNKTYIVYRNNNLIEGLKTILSDDDNYHSAYLIPGICDILKENNIMIKDLDAIGVNTGPGSFTGIRAGLTVARVLAQQFNIKAVGVNSLEILSKLNITGKKTAVLTDARKNKVYYAEFFEGKTIVAPELRDKESVQNINTDEYFVITDKSIGDYLKEHDKLALNYESADNNIGKYGSEITEDKLEAGSDDYHWAKLRPLYIQPPSITMKKETKEEKNG